MRVHLRAEDGIDARLVSALAAKPALADAVLFFCRPYWTRFPSYGLTQDLRPGLTYTAAPRRAAPPIAIFDGWGSRGQDSDDLSNFWFRNAQLNLPT
jgi:hypothetical protein